MTSQIETAPAPKAAEPVGRPKKGRWRIPMLLLAVVAAGGGIWWFTQGHRTTKAVAHGGSGAQSEASPAAADTSATKSVAVEVIHPKLGGLGRQTVQPGTVHAFEWADLYAKVSGYLEEQPVDIGTVVKRGDLLARIEDPELIEEEKHAEAAVKEAEAKVKQAEARVATAKADREAYRSEIKKAEATLQSAKASRQFRERQFHRYERLLGLKAVQQEVVDEVDDRYQAALAAQTAAETGVITAREQYNAAVARVAQAEADLNAAQAEVDVEKAALEKARVFVGYMTIKSRYNGVITNRLFHPGAFIRSAAEGGERPLLSVARTDKMRVVVEVPDVDVPYVDVGDPAVVRIDSLPDKEFKGPVKRMADSEDPQTRTMRVEIDLMNDSGLLREGFYGKTTIYLEPPSKKNLTIPTATVGTDELTGKRYVYVVKNGTAHRADVTVLHDDGIHAELPPVLSLDDQIITKPGLVTDGAPVEVVTPAPATPVAQAGATASATH